MSTLAPRIIGIVFGAVFIVSGVFAGALPLWRMVQARMHTANHVPVAATVLEESVDRGKKGTLRATVRYSYQRDGQTHDSRRIGLTDTGTDNIGSWQADWAQRLRQARDQGQPIQAWVNPTDPTDALLDRAIRWPFVFFLLPFALAFPAVGVLAMLVLWNAGATSKQAKRVAAQEARALRRASGPATAAGKWAFAALWCAITWPVAALVWSTTPALAARIGAVVMALIGLLLLSDAFRRK